MSYITTTYYYTVTVGSGAYPSPLTIIASGAVEPTGIGATGVYSGLAGNSVANYGIIDGGAGIGELPGGFGVDLSAGTLINSATAFINGGSGFYNGGDGVYLHGGTLTNYGTIDGGSVDHVFGSISGAGVDLSAGTLINNGYINAGSNTFFGAFAADLSGGTLINNGSIVGAGGHYDYGGGVYLNGGALTTSGLISGGVSGGPSGNGGLALQFGSAASTMTVDPGATFQGAIDGFAPGDTIDITGLTPAQVASYFNPVSYTLTTADEGTLQFAARYIGEYFTFNADLSGTGTDITLATGSGISTILPSTVTLGSTYDASPLTITATGGVYPGTGGATGVISNISGNSLTNHGAIQGGAGYYGGGSGGVGVNFTKAGMLTNTGSITGGTGGGSYSASGGQGGASVSLFVATLTNTGSITGGSGVGGGAGGVGVTLSSGATLTNSGSITGGMGGGVDPGYTGTGGQGGAGVFLNGPTLTTSGSISGGSGGSGTVNGAAGDAVQFGLVTSTLVVEPGAVFNGQVAANASVHDVLKLSGIQGVGSAITLGKQFTGFSVLDFASGAAWTADVSMGAASSTPGLTINGFTTSDTIDVAKLTPTQVAGDFNSSTHVLTTGSDGTLDFTNSFSGEYALFSSDGSGGTDITLVKGSGISTTRASTVNLGSAQPSPLTITNTGVVVPTAAGATGVLSDISGNSLTNAGAIDGGAGSNGTTGGEGGVGLNFEKGATVTNTGSITGGTGGTSSSAGAGGGGGIGVILDGGTLTNTGRITGGAGGGGSVGGGNPAEGAFLNGGTLITSGTISGGTGGSGGYPPLTGDAVLFGSIASTLTVDSGAVFNGAIGGFGFNDTIDMTNLTPTQVAGDFNSNTDVLSTASDGTLHFSGAFPDESFVFSSDGGAGTDITLSSGPGISTTFTGTVTMGSAAFPSPLTITTTGVVAPTVAGATAVLSDISGNSLTNAGAIDGGAGSNGTTGGHGGLGLNFEKGGAVTNTGSINGGHGGSASGAGAGGTGGVGADLFAGTLTNTGSITGGGGGNGTVGNGQPSPGVYLDGGTLISSGAVSGGSGGGGGYPPLSGDAVLFGSIASTLTVDPGAVFNGQVVATASVHDVLELSGTQSTGTAITLGTQFTHFSTLDFAPAAAWTVDAGMHAAPSGGLAINGFTTSDTIDITNLTPTQVEADFTSDVITTASDGTLTFNGVSGDTFVFTAKGAGTDVTVQPSPAATLAAAGHDLTNFVGDEHRALMGGQFTLGARSFGSAPTLHTDPALVAGSVHSLSADALSDHGLAHALSVGSHA